MLKLGVLGVLILLRLHVYAYDFEVDGIYYDMQSTSDLTCQVVKGDNLYSGSVQIPNSVNYKSKTISVIGIGDNAFSSCNNLQSILLPDGILYIGKESFLNCSSLTQVDLSESICEIRESAFNGCKALEKIIIPNNVINVEDYLFKDCSSLKNITLSNKIKNLDVIHLKIALACRKYCYLMV